MHVLLYAYKIQMIVSDHYPSDHPHHLILSCGIHQGTHSSAQLFLAANSYRSYGHASNIRNTIPCLAKILFSPWVVCFSSFYITLTEALLYKTDHYFRTVNILNTRLSVFCTVGVHSTSHHVDIFICYLSCACIVWLWNLFAEYSIKD